MKFRSSHRRAFSLLELLVVFGIIAIVAAMTVPAVNGYLSGQRLSSAAAVLSGDLGVAQQTANSSNRSIEIRFFKYADPETPNSANAYRAYQLISHGPNGELSLISNPRQFETGVVISPNVQYSTLFTLTEQTPKAQDPPLPRVGKNYTYIGFCYLPGGKTSLARPTNPQDTTSGRWCATLINEIHLANPDILPANFISLQIDPFNGSVTLFQP